MLLEIDSKLIWKHWFTIKPLYGAKIVILIKRKSILNFYMIFKIGNTPAGIRTHDQKSETEARGQSHLNLNSL